jgi:hypothetical protein
MRFLKHFLPSLGKNSNEQQSSTGLPTSMGKLAVAFDVNLVPHQSYLTICIVSCLSQTIAKFEGH